jgi:hypothetical protein
MAVTAVFLVLLIGAAMIVHLVLYMFGVLIYDIS